MSEISPLVTVDVCICRYVQRRVEVLLIKRKFPPFEGMWALPGGGMTPEWNESLEMTAARRLHDETGIRDVFIEQLKTYGDPTRRTITVAYYALVPNDALAAQSIRADDDASDYAWVNLRDLPSELAFDHRAILGDLLQRLAGKVTYAPIAFQLLGPRFTWSQLQGVYEFLLGRALQAPNFRRKIKAMYRITSRGKEMPMPKGRPARLLAFKGEKEMRL